MAEPLKYSIMLLVKQWENHHHTDDDPVPVLPLYGAILQCKSVHEAIQFIEQYDETPHSETFERYEIEVHYTDGDFIKAQFQDKTNVLVFLHRINQLPSNS